MLNRRIAALVILISAVGCFGAGGSTQPATQPRNERAYQVAYAKLGIRMTVTCWDEWRMCRYDDGESVITDAPATENTA